MAPVPYGFPVRSRLVRVKCTGTCTSGAGGCPFVAVNPWRMAANDGSAVYYSTSAYVTGAGVTLDNAATGVASANSNSDYSQVSLASSKINYRVVSCGLYMSPTSSLTARAGSLVCFTEPSHENLVGSSANGILGKSLNQIMAYESCRVRACPMSNQEHSVLWGTPENETEVGWFDRGDYDQLNTLATGVSWGLSTGEAREFLSTLPEYQLWWNYPIIAFSPDGPQTSFRFEVYAVIEFTGGTLTGKTPGNSDPVAFAAASNYVQQSPKIADSTPVQGMSGVRNVLAFAGKSTGYFNDKGEVQWGKVATDVGAFVLRT